MGVLLCFREVVADRAARSAELAEDGGTITAADGATRRVPARTPFVVLDGQTLTVDEPAGGLRVYV
ncbi:hypothetical protein GUG50_14990, partial [Xanthomonas citri pv. citri]|nr:hypothetical protein [Xanthomonas citri pv. citri]